jgi:hypothetical protein
MSRTPAAPASDARAPRAGAAFRVAAAIGGALWSAFLLPPQLEVWAGRAASPAWIQPMQDLAVYDGLRDAIRAAGSHDFYMVFGAASALSVVAYWFALAPVFRGLGWSGRAFGWLLLLTAATIVVSYANHHAGSPLRLLWGAELLALLVLGIWGFVVAAATRDVDGASTPIRVAFGLTLPVLIVGLLGLGYWPHGPLVTFGLLCAYIAATGLAVAAPERPATSPG